MSVTFCINGDYDIDDYGSYLNVSNANGRDLIASLGLEVNDELMGEVSAKELLDKVSKACGGPDEGRDFSKEWGERKNFYAGRRPPGRMNDYYDKLVSLCERAGDIGRIRWG